MSALDDLLREGSTEPDPPRRARRKPRRSLGSRLAGGLGELLITTGVLIALFVVWQVWWTDVVANRQAGEAIERWEQELVDSPEVAGIEQQGPPPQEVAVGPGEQFATMYVPAWGESWQFPIASGVDYATVLDAGFVGHYAETALPGQVGNFGLAGHRQSYGRPFYDIDSLQPGDSIIVRTAQAWYVYEVSDYEVILPHQSEVLLPVPHEPQVEPTEAMITLTTCHPLWSIAERYVVYGELDHWVDPADGRPEQLITNGSQ